MVFIIHKLEIIVGNFLKNIKKVLVSLVASVGFRYMYRIRQYDNNVPRKQGNHLTTTKKGLRPETLTTYLSLPSWGYMD